MTPDEGMKRLAFHTEPTPGSFLEMLRPFRGLNERIFDDVLTALDACAPVFAGDRLPQPLVSAVWAISHLGRLWALDPNGMLRRNALISDADVTKLSAFLERFDLAVTLLLNGSSQADAFDNG